MDNQIKTILKDLYELEPSLSSSEEQLKKIISEMLASKPNTNFDSRFAAQLKEKLLVKEKHNKFNIFSIININPMKKYALAAVGVLVVALAVTAISLQTIKPKKQIALKSNFNIRPAVTSVSANAFGMLSGLQNNVKNESALGASDASLSAVAPTEQARSLVAEDLDRATSSAKIGMGGGGGYDIGSPAMIWAGENYKYLYQGEKLTLTEEQLPVLKRVKNSFSANQFTSLISQLNFTGINLSSFKNIELQNISFNENRDFGFSVSIDLFSESVYVGQNWLKWRSPDFDCRDEKCFEANRLKMSDVPADDKLIAAANSFVAEYGVQIESYGKPEIDNVWRTYYQNTDDQANFYIPDTISVIYPLRIDGKEVYEQGGSKDGLRVNVNIRDMRVSGISGIMTQNYESSSYAAVTDWEQILKMAEGGGLNGVYYYYGYGEAAEPVEIGLGSPSVAYMKYWKYNEKNGQSDELLIPALIFPIEKVPEGLKYFNRQSVIVPLIKEIFDQQSFDYGAPRPLPIDIMIKEDTVSSDSGMEAEAVTDLSLPTSN